MLDKLKDYVPVNERLAYFWHDHPNGRIETLLVKSDSGIMIVKALLYDGSEHGKPIATGHAQEKEDSGYINKTSALENCETSAVGRALAIAGYEIKKAIASREEMENAMERQSMKNENEKTCNDCGIVLTPAVARYSRQKFGQELCMKCQKIHSSSA